MTSSTCPRVVREQFRLLQRIGSYLAGATLLSDLACHPAVAIGNGGDTDVHLGRMYMDCDPGGFIPSPCSLKRGRRCRGAEHDCCFDLFTCNRRLTWSIG